MADDSDSLVLSISADVRQVKRALDRLVVDSKSAAKAIEGTFAGTQGAANSAVASIAKVDRAMAASAKKMSGFAGTLKSGIGGLGVGIGAGFAVQQAKEIIDSNIRIQNSLKVTGLEGDALMGTYNNLSGTALKFGANFETLAKVFSRVAVVQNELGVSTQQLEKFTDNVGAALKVQGTSAQDAQGPLLQLAQALSTSVVRAEEFNSINEGLPIVLKTVANGMTETGGSIAKLRQKMLDGNLTSKEFFAAFERGSAVLQEQAGKASLTLGQSFENIKTQMILVAEQIDRSTGLAGGLSNAIGTLSGAIGGFGNVVEAIANSQLAGFLKTLGEINDTILKWEPVYQALGVFNKETLDAIATAIRPDASLTGASEALAALREQVVATSTDAADLAKVLRKMGEQGNFENIQKTFFDLTESLAHGTATTEKFEVAIKALRDTGTDAGDRIAKSLTESMKVFNAEMQKVAEAVSKDIVGAVDVLIAKFRDELPNSLNTLIDQLGAVAKATAGIGTPLDAIIGQFKALQGLMPDMSSITGAPGMLAGAGFGLGDLTQQAVGTPSIAKEFIKNQATSAAARNNSVDRLNDEFAVKVAKLLQAFPDVKVNEAFRTFEQQAEIRRRHEAMPGGVAAHPAALPGHSRHEKGSAVDLSIGGLSEERKRAVEAEARRLGLANPIRNDRGHFQESGPAGDDSVGRAKKAATDLDDWMEKSRQAIELKTRENEIDKDTTKTVDERSAAKEREKLIQEGLTAAQEQYGVVTDAQKEKIIEMADAQAKLGLAADQTAEAQQKAAQAAKDQAAAAEAFSEQIGQIASSALSGFISDLRAGKSAGEAFSNMLNKIIDGLIDMAIQSLFSKDALGGLFGGGGAAAGGGGGGGILGSLFGGLFGGAAEKGGIVGTSSIPTVPVNPRHFRNARSYARGGMPGQPPGSIPIYAHPGELIIPKDMVNGMKSGTAPGGGDTHISNTLGPIGIDMAQTGLVTSTTESGKFLGKQIQAAVEVVLVRESRPGGILRKQGTM